LVETIDSLSRPYSNPRSIIDLFFMFEYGGTCSFVVGELCGCIENRKESHAYQVGGFEEIVKITILFHRLQRGVTHQMVVPSTRTWTKSTRIHL
jgi:hypothetical protein